MDITKEIIEKFVCEQVCLLGYAAPYESKSLDLDLLLEDSGLDYLDTMNIIIAVEEKFNIEISAQEEKHFFDSEKNTSQDIIDFLKDKLLG